MAVAKKASFVLFLLLTGELALVSCNLLCPCGCFSGPKKKIDILSWRITTVGENYQEVLPTILQSYDQVYKWFFVDERNLVMHEGNSDKGHFNIAYACSPAPMIAVQRFASIQIRSLSEVSYLNADDSIQIGEDITDRFVMSLYYDPNFMTVDDFMDHEIYDEDRYRLRLKDKPYQEVTLNFEMVITLSDGKVFELKNELLTVE